MNAAFEQNKSNAMNSGSMSEIEVLEDNLSERNQNQTRIHRTLTDKRKEYVRRVSAVKSNCDQSPSYGSLQRTFKSSVLKTFSFELDAMGDDTDNCISSESSAPPSLVNEMIQQFNLLENDKVETIAQHKPVDTYASKSEVVEDRIDASIPSVRLFQVCMLIGYNTATKKPYIKCQYPTGIDVPSNVDHLVFPSKKLRIQNKANQNFSLVLTDENGFHIYGYCRRVLPESSDICLPLTYCLISEVRAPGFYFKILEEIESRHGQSESQKLYLLRSLYNHSIPESGKFVYLKLPSSPRPKTTATSKLKVTPKRLSLEANPKWLMESGEKTIKKADRNDAPFDLSLINKSLFEEAGINRGDEIIIRRPNDLRLESTELSDLHQTLGTEILINIFSSLLLERKVILFTENISKLSSCVLALQTLLYPFQWQYTLVTVLPHDLVEVCGAPTPLLAGMLEPIPFEVEDGIVIDLETRTITHKCGDETSILPSVLHQSLQISLSMVDILHQGRMLSSVLIAEAFLRFFIELFAGYNQKYFDVSLTP